ncbi:uncharacterized protein LOC131941806 [Physella acuta]|uniref:uncharacterized protein LOC131941806 n=1 Tax=Physella acuta TaxID=109671 RepID=UPI0027DE5F30|nr:uncharacterized protein LOC131941806 [Physella acuta]
MLYRSRGKVDGRKLAFVALVCGGYALFLELKSLEESRREGWWRQKTESQPKVKRNNSGAKNMLIDYNRRFGTERLKVNPNNVDSIKTWYTALAMIDWYLDIGVESLKCEDKQMYDFWSFCQETKFSVQSPCIVYSFGLRIHFEFEDRFAHLGCVVKSFDPSINISGRIKSPNVDFYNIGIGAVNTNVYMPTQPAARTTRKKGPWKLRTLRTILQMQGHQNKILDVLKIDIKSNLWVVLDNILETGAWRQIRHLLLEFNLYPTHPHKEDYVILYRMLTRLREVGFIEYYRSPSSDMVLEDESVYLHRRVSYYNSHLVLDS